MILPDVSWRGQPGMAALLEALEARAGKARYVGGAVRDALLGLDVSDVDIATSLRPEEVLASLGKVGIKAVPTGIEHGTVTAVLAQGPVEVTTLRRDVSTDGRRATVAFSDDWKEDAARRDFTINALSADPLTGAIFDYFDGLSDLESRTVRFIGDPLLRIAEDHLRILRFFRFHARFGSGLPDQQALDACIARANDLMALSRERIADETLKLLALADPEPTVRMMVDCAIFRPVLPEITMDGVERLRRLIARERMFDIVADPLRRLAALLPADVKAVAGVAGRLRLSNRQQKRLVSSADWPAERERDPALLAYAIGGEEALDRLLLRDEEQGLEAAVPLLINWTRPQFPIGGGDLIAMGLTPGPVVARTLRAIENEWARAGFSTDKAVVRALAKTYVERVLRESI